MKVLSIKSKDKEQEELPTSLKNVNTFSEQYRHNLEESEELDILPIFTLLKPFYKNFHSLNPLFPVSYDTNSMWKYNFKCNNKRYHFSILSDQDFVLKNDKKVLTNTKRMTKSLFRTLRLACSLDNPTMRLIIGNSKQDLFHTIITYTEDGIEKVIDYSKNIIMPKEEYYNLFNFSDLNILDKYDLYRMHYLLNRLENYQDTYLYLIFLKEILNDIKDSANLVKKYSHDGTNFRNFAILGGDCDCLFFQSEDYGQMKYHELIEELDNFTENPQKLTKHITYDKTRQQYVFKHHKFGFFTFGLLSDIVSSEEVKSILKSNKRYHKCHINAHNVIGSLDKKNKENAYIVAGQFRENENDYFYHSWVEIDDKNVVIDWNHNLIMNRDKYYKLFEIVVINKTKYEDMTKITHTINEKADLNMHSMTINYFGDLIYRDLEKNRHLFK